MIHTKVRFQDGISRELDCFVTASNPYQVLLGQPFMKQHGLFCIFTKDSHFEIYQIDHSDLEHPSLEHEGHRHKLVYSSRKLRFGELTDDDRAIGDKICPIIDHKAKKARKPDSVRSFTRKKDYARKLLTWWGRVPHERKQLLSLFHVRLRNLSKQDMDAALEKAGFRNQDHDDESEKIQRACALGEHQPDIQCDFPEGQKELNRLVYEEFPDVFSSKASDVGKSRGKVAKIRLAKDTVVNVPNYRCPLGQRPMLKQLIQDLVDGGVVEPDDSSEFNSPCMLVKKKSDASYTQVDDAALKAKPDYRLVVDYRKLNDVIENVVFPMPRIQDILSKYHGSTVFSTMDIRHAFYTISIDEESRKYTAFSCEFGKWRFRFLPQGLKISPAVFQRQIHSDLKDIEEAEPYIDDIFAGTVDVKQHLAMLRRLFRRMRECGYKLKLSKCEFLRKAVKYTGFLVSKDGVSVDPDKLAGAQKLAQPHTISDVKSVLGFTNFLRAHLPYYSDAVGPIQDLLRIKLSKGEANIDQYWTEKQDRSLAAIRKMLLSPKVLAFPDPQAPYILYTDASKYHMSGVLMQRNKSTNKLHALGYWSRAFKGSQKVWSALVKEARAVLEAVEHFAVYIKGCPVELRCDHKPLQRFLEAKTKNEMVNRWSLNLQEYDLKFVWVKSEDNVSDCLSRMVAEDIKEELRMQKLYEPFTAEEIAKEFAQAPRRNLKAEKAAANEKLQEVKENQTVAAVTPNTAEDQESLSDIVSRAFTRLPPEKLKEQQQADNYCKRIIAALPTAKPKCNGEFFLREGLLFRAMPNCEEGRERLPSAALVIPKAYYLSVCYNLHVELLHAGRDRMLGALRPRVYWKGMDKHVSELVRGCQVCQVKNARNAKYSSIHIKPPPGPGQRLAMDLWDSGDGLHLLTVICLHSMYPFVEPVENKEGRSIAIALEKILGFVRDPREIISDNGGEFISQEVAELLKSRKIKHIFVAPHHPQSNGVLERFHRYLGSTVRLVVNLGNEGDTLRAVLRALEVYRKTPHTCTAETPLFLFTGQEPLYSFDHLLPTTVRHTWDENTNTLDLTQLHTAYALARKNTCLARLKHKVTVAHKPSRINVGDRVLRKNFAYDKKKLSLQWLPGYRVVKFENENTENPTIVHIQHTESGRKARVSIKHVRKTDPVSELLGNTSVDCFPGTSKLYFHSSDLKDLNWEAMKEVEPLEPELEAKANEVVRDREGDELSQETPMDTEVVPAESEIDKEVRERPKRSRRLPRHLRKDFVLPTFFSV